MSMLVWGLSLQRRTMRSVVGEDPLQLPYIYLNFIIFITLSTLSLLCSCVFLVDTTNLIQSIRPIALNHVELLSIRVFLSSPSVSGVTCPIIFGPVFL